MSVLDISQLGILSIAEIAKLAQTRRDAQQQLISDEEKARAKAAITTQSNTASADKFEQDAADEQSRGQKQSKSLVPSDDTTQLARLLPPRPVLSPSDEVALFAQQQTSQPSNASASIAGEAVAEDGSSVQVDIITQKETAPSAQILTFSPRAVTAALSVYARNNELGYDASLTPLAA